MQERKKIGKQPRSLNLICLGALLFPSLCHPPFSLHPFAIYSVPKTLQNEVPDRTLGATDVKMEFIPLARERLIGGLSQPPETQFATTEGWWWTWVAKEIGLELSGVALFIPLPTALDWTSAILTQSQDFPEILSHLGETEKRLCSSP